MSLGYKGGIISATPPTTTGGPSGTASGIWSLQTQLQAIANGDWPTPFVFSTLYTWGYNYYGELGVGNPTRYPTATQVSDSTDWAYIALGAGREYVGGVKTDGTLWMWGDNVSGQLGLGDVVPRFSPTQVGSLTNWSKVVIGAKCAYAIKTDNTLWGWGDNGNGQLGLGDIVHRSSPVQIASDVADVQASTSSDNMMYLTTTNAVYTCGTNAYGQLGDNSVTAKSSPVQVFSGSVGKIRIGNANFMAAIYESNGELYTWGRNNQGQLGIGSTANQSQPQQISQGWDDVALGNDHMVGVASGDLYGWGDGASYVFVDGTTTDRSLPVQIGSESDWASVYASSSVSGAIKTNGTVWAAGTNPAGGLGNGTTLSTLPSDTSFTQVLNITSPSMVVPGQSCIGYLVGNTWYASGLSSEPFNLFSKQNYGARSSPVQVGSDNNWKSVALGQYYGLFISKTGALYSCGANVRGQLGQNNLIVYSSPVQVGSDTDWDSVYSGSQHSVAIKTDGTLWTWGNNTYGQLGQSDAIERSSPTQVGSLSDWQTVACYNAGTLAIKTDGTLWGWGLNDNGVVGDGTNVTASSPVQVGALTNWASIACCDSSVLAVKTDGTLWAWGFNGLGQLGDGTTISRSSPVQIGALTNWAKVGGSTFTSAAIKTDGTLWAWGYNADGAVGDNTVITTSSPVQIGTDTNWSMVNGISSGNGALQAVKTDGTLWGWGLNTGGELGDGTVISRSSPVQIGSLTNWTSGVTAQGGGNTVGAFST